MDTPNPYDEENRIETPYIGADYDPITYRTIARLPLTYERYEILSLKINRKLDSTNTKSIVDLPFKALQSSHPHMTKFNIYRCLYYDCTGIWPENKPI